MMNPSMQQSLQQTMNPGQPQTNPSPMNVPQTPQNMNRQFPNAPFNPLAAQQQQRMRGPAPPYNAAQVNR